MRSMVGLWVLLWTATAVVVQVLESHGADSTLCAPDGSPRVVP
jgi:hypothetical protein